MNIENLVNELYVIIKKTNSQEEYSELLKNMPELLGRTVFDTLTSVPDITLIEYPNLFSSKQELKELYKKSLKEYNDFSINDLLSKKYSKEIALKSIYQDQLTNKELSIFIEQLESVLILIPDKYKKNIKDFDIVLSKNEKHSAISRSLKKQEMIIKYDNSDLKNLQGEIIHEIGHLLEDSNFKLKNFSHKFLLERIYSKEKIKFNDFSDECNLEIFDERNSEVYPGPFISPYIGKVYNDLDNYNAETEVLSVGLQSMLLDPLNFLFKDVEHFLFIYNVLKEKYD